MIDSLSLAKFNAPLSRLGVGQFRSLFSPDGLKARTKCLGDSGRDRFASLLGWESGQLVRFRIFDVKSHGISIKKPI
jgi:hypothetical protein